MIDSKYKISNNNPITYIVLGCLRNKLCNCTFYFFNCRVGFAFSGKTRSFLLAPYEHEVLLVKR